MSAKRILAIGGILVGGLLIFQKPAHAGGAVAKRRQTGQQIAQQRAMQQRAIQQAMIQKQLAAQAAAGAGPELQMHGQINAIMPEGEVTQDILVPMPIDESQVKEVVDIEDLWNTFETTSNNWPLIMEPQAKVLTVDRWIHQYQEKGITISKSPAYYAQMIDGISEQNPALLNQPFEKLLQFMAIVEYDFDNGTDKDQLAKKFLGEQAWKSNRHRLGLE